MAWQAVADRSLGRRGLRLLDASVAAPMPMPSPSKSSGEVEAGRFRSLQDAETRGTRQRLHDVDAEYEWALEPASRKGRAPGQTRRRQSSLLSSGAISLSFIRPLPAR